MKGQVPWLGSMGAECPPLGPGEPSPGHWLWLPSSSWAVAVPYPGDARGIPALALPLGSVAFTLVEVRFSSSVALCFIRTCREGKSRTRTFSSPCRPLESELLLLGALCKILASSWLPVALLFQTWRWGRWPGVSWGWDQPVWKMEALCGRRSSLEKLGVGQPETADVP